MMQNFRTYNQAKLLYQQAKNLKLKGEVRDQLMRACLSVCLNLAEGDAKPTVKDRKRFFHIALASLREIQALIEIEELNVLHCLADRVGASLYCLCRSID